MRHAKTQAVSSSETNLPDLHALSSAIDLITTVGVPQIEEHVLSLGDHLVSKLEALGVDLVGPRERSKRAHIYVMALPIAEWIDYLSQQQVRVSPERGGVRISFGLFNTLADVDQVCALIEARLRKSTTPRAAVARDLD